MTWLRRLAFGLATACALAAGGLLLLRLSWWTDHCGLAVGVASSCVDHGWRHTVGRAALLAGLLFIFLAPFSVLAVPLLSAGRSSKKDRDPIGPAS